MKTLFQLSSLTLLLVFSIPLFAQNNSQLTPDRLKFNEGNTEKAFMYWNGNGLYIRNNEVGQDRFTTLNLSTAQGSINLKSESSILLELVDELILKPKTSTSDRSRITMNDIGRMKMGTDAYLARLTIIDSLYGQRALYAKSQGKAIYGESTGSFAVSSYGVHGKSIHSAGVHGYSDNASGVYGLSATNTGVYGFSNANTADTYGVHGESSVRPGVFGESNNSFGVLGNSIDSYGVYGYSEGSDGVRGFTTDIAGSGVWGQGPVFGVRGLGDTWAIHGHSTNGVGVRGFSINDYGVSGKTNNNSSYAGYFEGDVYTTASYLPSDRKLKQEEKELANATFLLQQLRPVTYAYQREKYSAMMLPEGERFGLIAQELEEVLPQLIKETRHIHFDEKTADTLASVTFKAVNYVELIPILIAGFQEQESKIEQAVAKNEQLEAENKALQERLEKLEEMVAALAGEPSTPFISDGKTEPESRAFLAQNQPNPFSETTTIQYRLPKTTQAAYLHITNQQGQHIKKVALAKAEAGQYELQSGALPAGTYFYSLIVDGELVDTKQLVLTK